MVDNFVLNIDIRFAQIISELCLNLSIDLASVSSFLISSELGFGGGFSRGGGNGAGGGAGGVR